MIDKIDALAATVEKGFAALDAKIETGFAAVADDIALRPTQADFETLLESILDERLQPVLRELRILRVELDHLREKVDNITGFRVEIDHALERIAAIEKHLGIAHKIAA